MLPAYAELHCLSNFSFLRGASHPEELVERAQTSAYAAFGSRCLALWFPKVRSETTFHMHAHTHGSHGEKSSLTPFSLDARWIADIFSTRAWMAAELIARAGDRLRLERLSELSRACGL